MIKFIRHRLLEILLALVIGALSYYIFLSIYGIVAAYDVDNQLYKWIYFLPGSLRKSAFFLHGLILEFLAALPLIACTGILLGLLIREAPCRHGVISFVGAFCFYTYFIFVKYDFGFWGTKYKPVWVTVSSITIWISLFMGMTSFGFYLKKR